MPAPVERGGVAYGHYLDGDGYVTRLSFPGDRIAPTFKSTFVTTPDYVRESAADEILTRSTLRTQRPANSIAAGDTPFCLHNGLDVMF